MSQLQVARRREASHVRRESTIAGVLASFALCRDNLVFASRPHVHGSGLLVLVQNRTDTASTVAGAAHLLTTPSSVRAARRQSLAVFAPQLIAAARPRGCTSNESVAQRANFELVPQLLDSCS